MKPDLVYILKDSKVNEEFRYSLRSVEKYAKNYNSVITIGGCVQGITTDKNIFLHQIGATKYDKVNLTLREICLNPLISDNFVLMNDDFFIMKDTDMSKLKYYYRCSMSEYIEIIIERLFQSEYTERLAKAALALEKLNLDTRCFELHIPMLFNKHKLLEIFGVFPGFNGVRSLYGNWYKVRATKMNDCKIFTFGDDFIKDTQFLSTSDGSFRNGAVGEYLRSTFDEPSKFEH